ncbi:hypothetical protein V6N13_040397 [Hibiscus sabdariffa]
MWNRRNSLVHGSQPQPVWATVTSATLLHAVYLAANDQSRRPVSTTVFSPGVWSPPPLGTVAVPVDGAFSLDQDASRGRLKGDYFRFEDCWSKEPACVERVRSVWEGTSGPTLHKLQAVWTALRGWQAEHRNSSRRHISELHSFIDSCMEGPLCASDRAAFLVAKK